MRSLLPFICSFLTCTSLAQGTPKTMTKVEVQLQGPAIPAGSFAAKPRTMYRAGSRYCRVEEAPDPDHGLQGLLIVDEPGYWMANLMTKTARHGLDSGPTFNCHMPMFSDDPDKEAAGLEFGLEMEFFKAKGATPHEGAVLQGKKTTQYQVEIGNSKLALFMYGIPERPLAVGRVRGDRGEIYWYSGYGQVPFDAKLFAKPEGLKIEEIKP
jgi:hypothetical protein